VKSTTVTVNYQGSEYTASIQTNASATNPLFDAGRGLFNFTLSGEDGSVGSFAVTIPKALLEGTPVVFVDNARIASTYTENSTHYFVHFEYALSMHTATVEGSNTIPEFPSAFFVPAATLALIVLIALILSLKKRRKGEGPTRQSIKAHDHRLGTAASSAEQNGDDDHKHGDPPHS
jgi:hypothetical protein